MGEERPLDIKAIFAEALDRPTPEERAAYLKAACGGNAELLAGAAMVAAEVNPA